MKTLRIEKKPLVQKKLRKRSSTEVKCTILEMREEISATTVFQKETSKYMNRKTVGEKAGFIFHCFILA